MSPSDINCLLHRISTHHISFIILAIEYSLDVYTGSVDNAGTDADVFITVYGKRGNSGTKLLDKSGQNDFERKRYDADKFGFFFGGA